MPSVRRSRIYDPMSNCGFLCIGACFDTSCFAVEAICDWWGNEGSFCFPQAERQLILVDVGESKQLPLARLGCVGYLSAFRTA